MKLPGLLTNMSKTIGVLGMAREGTFGFPFIHLFFLRCTFSPWCFCMLRLRETVERAEARVMVEELEANLLALVLPWWDQSPLSIFSWRTSQCLCWL